MTPENIECMICMEDNIVRKCICYQDLKRDVCIVIIIIIIIIIIVIIIIQFLIVGMDYV